MVWASGAARVAAVEVVSAGRLRLLAGGELGASVAEPDHGYFNHQEYEQNVLRRVRLRLNAELRLGSRVAVLGEARHVNRDHPRVYALYLRVRPWRDVPLDVQAGQVPPVFGSYPRTYANENSLVGEPLGYQYLTALRADAAPARLVDLLAMRGRGWRVRYPIGAADGHSGLPAVCTLRWDTGVQARLTAGAFEAAAAVTQGSPSNPRVRDDNGDKAIAGRLAWRPVVGLVAGVSAARARYLDEDVEARLGRGKRGQRILGADLEYSYGRWRVRAEGFAAEWDLPVADAAVTDGVLPAWTAMVEMRVKVRPGLSAAARADHLDFGDVATATGATPWEYAVTRLEAGLAFTPHRQVVLKGAYQRDRRDGGSVRGQSFVVGQVLLWF